MPAMLLHAGRLTFPTGWSAASHRHPFTEMLVLLEGRMFVRAESWSREVVAGDVAIYAPGMVHGEVSRVGSGGRIEMIYLACERLASRGGVVSDARGRVRTLARWIVEEQASTYPRRYQSAGRLFAALEAELQRLASHRAHDAFEEIRSFMRARLKAPHRVAELARRCHSSPFHFIRKYRAAVGRTPMEDLRLMRLQAACDLLLTTDWPLKRVAAEVGFCDEYYFSRAFKQHFRVSPGTFRQRDTVTLRGI